MSVSYVVGNTYRRIRSSENPPLDRTGVHSKIHEWTLYVDVIGGGNPNVLERVSFDLGSTFQPQTFVCTCPIRIKDKYGLEEDRWRFATKQTSYGSISANITLRGVAGGLCETSWQIDCSGSGSESEKQYFTDRRQNSNSSLKYLKLVETQQFGIELELTSALQVSPEQVAETLQDQGIDVQVILDSYRQGRVTSTSWKLVPDSSIMCSPSLPDCNKFELVSPILQGGHGLSQVNRVLRALQGSRLKVNKSMGFHVHVNVEDLSLQQLIKVCQNFIKYEDVMDSFLPPSRRTGSTESNKFFQSNRRSVGVRSTNKERHARLAHSRNLQALADAMNVNGDRYYKLNLQNLCTGRQPTLEFRQHSATVQYDKVNAWIRFCVALVLNSARLAPPSCMASSNKPLDEQLELLFHHVIKDRALRDFYLDRQDQVMEHGGGAEEACCASCAHGNPCRTTGRARKRQQ